MKYLVKKSVLLLLVVLAFCACDNSNDNGEGIQPNPQPSKSVVNYTGEVEFVVDAPQIREDIEQDLKANPLLEEAGNISLSQKNTRRFLLYICYMR